MQQVEHLEVSLSKVDPSDCVDMDCDGRRKVVITDKDNTFFKKSKPTTLISKSEAEWSGDGYNGNTKYGLGEPSSYMNKTFVTIKTSLS